MKDMINFLVSFTQYATSSQSEAEGAAVILFLSLCAGAVFAMAAIIGTLIAGNKE